MDRFLRWCRHVAWTARAFDFTSLEVEAIANQEGMTE
jgi:hypothetical protein